MPDRPGQPASSPQLRLSSSKSALNHHTRPTAAVAATGASARRPLLRRKSSLKRHLSVFDIARLTICMLGVQFTWTVELGYGTPYLLSLGIPKTLTPLVWLAGPLSGLVIQPVVGVFSDALDWKMGRRRPFILIGATLTIISMYMVAYARELALMIVGHGEEDTAYTTAIKAWTIGFAVIGFYCLDFSINAVQASCRSLIMDIPPTHQQETCNAWSGWMNNLGSVVGFFAGNLDLVKYFSPVLGDTQIKILANLAMLCFAACLSISCLSVKEIPYIPTEEDGKRSVWSTLGNIWRAFRHLPAEIQRICNVQFFVWMGWFPFLFYSTSWVGEILNRYESGDDQDNNLVSHMTTGAANTFLARPWSSSPFSSFDNSDRAGGIPDTASERAGSFALLCYAGVAVVCGILIPKITPQEIGPNRWPRNPFTLKNLWTMSLVWFSVCMGMTWFVDDLWAATMVIALCGVPWAVAMWIPFAMVGEIISDMKDRLEDGDDVSNLDQSQRALLGTGGGGGAMDYGTMSPSSTLPNSDAQSSGDHSTNNSALSHHQDDADMGEEDDGLMGASHGLTAAEIEAERRKQGPHLDAGLVLGVHNMYIVFPQFLDAIIASCLFAMIGSMPRSDRPPSAAPIPPSNIQNPSWLGGLVKTTVDVATGDPEPIGWVLRFGGLMALVAAYLSRRL
ncbi:hypothetical protein EDD11_001500 [Mortierella claussenii]|nr:hypothetical protein EDD11_001500 [Mortierella claussenii]